LNLARTAIVLMGGYELWREVAIRRFVRRGWPRWCAELAFELSDF
jgi:hypothetical protein